MSINEEKIDVGFAEGLLDSDAMEGGSEGGPVSVNDRIVPHACGAVAALWSPDAAWMLADVADVSGDSGAYLGPDALIGAEQWHVAMSGAAGDDINQSDIVEMAKARDDVLVEDVEILQSLGEEALPEAGGLGKMVIACLKKIGLVFSGCNNLAIEILGKLRDEDGMAKLLEQDRRKAKVTVEADIVALQVFEDAEQG